MKRQQQTTFYYAAGALGLWAVSHYILHPTGMGRLGLAVGILGLGIAALVSAVRKDAA
ncbi:hypothetical protein G7Y41_08950 [Schaalia sp. ZJ405]|uniref:hypothetical protein n=1 Tax=Schaalia sp. ZJ405 TaxID=2709403 RepID=UPI0013EBAD2F|nr:hypothetical protein [Schaalia sp. ZJ405]QPK81153.1 hypothetical protein G7Y41_08950 [Schaalia sp. ZJ405]